MDALLTQLPAMVGVLIGVVGTLVTTTVADARMLAWESLCLVADDATVAAGGALWAAADPLEHAVRRTNFGAGADPDGPAA